MLFMSMLRIIRLISIRYDFSDLPISVPHTVGRVAQGLEGSRFMRWQLYRLAAGGSRERLEVRQFYGPLYPRNRTDAMGKTLR